MAELEGSVSVDSLKKVSQWWILSKKNIGENSLDHLSESTSWHLSQYMSHMENLCGTFKIFVLSRGFCTHWNLIDNYHLVDLAGWVNRGALPLLLFFVSEILHNF